MSTPGERQNDTEGDRRDRHHTAMAPGRARRLPVDEHAMKSFLEGIKWLLTISVVGLWLGFFQYIGWDAARTLVPFVLEVLGK